MQQRKKIRSIFTYLNDLNIAIHLQCQIECLYKPDPTNLISCDISFASSYKARAHMCANPTICRIHFFILLLFGQIHNIDRKGQADCSFEWENSMHMVSSTCTIRWIHATQGHFERFSVFTYIKHVRSTSQTQVLPLYTTLPCRVMMLVCKYMTRWCTNVVSNCLFSLTKI